MNNSAKPEWILSERWAVSRSRSNWALYRNSGNRWRPYIYHPTLEMLLKGFYKELLRTEPAQPSLAEHIEHCSGLAQASARAFEAQIGTLLTLPLPDKNDGLPAASTSLEGVENAS